MTHHRDAHLDQTTDYFKIQLGGALKLYRLGLSLFDEAACVGDSLGDIDLIAHERQVCHHQRMMGTAGDGFGMMQHLFHRDRMGGLMSEGDHGQAVSDQN